MRQKNTGVILGALRCYVNVGLGSILLIVGLTQLSVRRTISCEMASTTPNWTSLPASKRKVQCSYPSGAALQAVSVLKEIKQNRPFYVEVIDGQLDHTPLL